MCRRSSDGSPAPESLPQDQEGAILPFAAHHWLFLGLILLFVVVVRTRLLSFPLERDEGENAYWGQLILQGIPPYKLAYNMKLPGTYFMYAFLMALFGQTVGGVHLGLMVMNCLTILLIYKIGARVVNAFAGIIMACTYALLSLSISVGLCRTCHPLRGFLGPGRRIGPGVRAGEEPAASLFRSRSLVGLGLYHETAGDFLSRVRRCLHHHSRCNKRTVEVESPSTSNAIQPALTGSRSSAPSLRSIFIRKAFGYRAYLHLWSHGET